MLAKLFEFGEFHPLDREGLVQDIGVLILSSKAQGVYADAAHLLPPDYSPSAISSATKVETFKANDPAILVNELSKELASFQNDTQKSDEKERKKESVYAVEAIREAAFATFEGLSRIRFSYDDRRAVLLEGYVPSTQIEGFKNLLKKYLLYDEPVGKKEAETQNVPSLLSERRGVSLFENITLMRGFPKYNEIDPTPITAFVFPLFFGIMFCDMGHGIVLFLFGYALWRLFRGNYNYWGRVLMVLGSSSIVTGFIRGAFFGYDFGSPVGYLVHFPVIFEEGFTLSAVPFWLEVSIILGTFHLSSAYFLFLLNRWHSKEYSEALLSGVSTLVLYGSAVPLTLALIGAGLDFTQIFSNSSPTPFFQQLLGVNIPVSLVASISLPVFLVALIVLVIGKIYLDIKSDTGRWMLAKSIGTGLLEGLVKPFEFFTNTISYLRLGILAILGMILTSLAMGALDLGVVGILFAILANIGIMTIEAFMVYIQDLRLQVYEWLSGFYSGTGTAFEPLTSKGLIFSVKWN